MLSADAPEELILQASLHCCDKCTAAILSCGYGPDKICAIDSETFEKLYVCSDGGIIVYRCIDECGIYLDFANIIDQPIFENIEKYFEVIEKVGALRIVSKNGFVCYFSKDNHLYSSAGSGHHLKGETYNDTYKNFLLTGFTMKPVHEHIRSRYKASKRWD